MSDRLWDWLAGQTSAVAVLVLLVLLARRVLGGRVQACWWHGLWVVVALRVVVPWVPGTPWSVWNLQRVDWAGAAATAVRDLSGEVPGVREETVVSRLLDADAVELGVGVPVTGGGVVGGEEAATTTAMGAVEVVGAARSQTAEAVGGEAVARGGIDWKVWMLVVWAGGVVVLGFASIRVVLVRRRLLARARKVQGGVWREALAEARAAMGCGRSVSVVVSDEVPTPGLCGWWRPVVVVPEGKVSVTEARHVMLHELGHVRRGDVVWTWLMQVAVAVQWFNPLVWWARRCLVRERELACDAMVLRRLGEGGVAAYGTTLLRMGERMRSAGGLVPLLGMARCGSELRGRISAVVDWRRPGVWKAWFSRVVACVVTVVGATGAVRPVVVPFAGLGEPAAGDIQVAVAVVDLPVGVVGEVLMGGGGGVERVLALVSSGEGEVVGEVVGSGIRGEAVEVSGRAGMRFEARGGAGVLEVGLRAWAADDGDAVGVFDGSVTGRDGEVVLAGAMGGGEARGRVVLVRLADGDPL